MRAEEGPAEIDREKRREGPGIFDSEEGREGTPRVIDSVNGREMV